MEIMTNEILSMSLNIPISGERLNQFKYCKQNL